MNILRIALNDVRVVLKDRLILLWWLAMPLTFVFLLSFMIRESVCMSSCRQAGRQADRHPARYRASPDAHRTPVIRACWFNLLVEVCAMPKRRPAVTTGVEIRTHACTHARTHARTHTHTAIASMHKRRTRTDWGLFAALPTK